MSGTERDKIEKLCRYIARPAVALERLSQNANGPQWWQFIDAVQRIHSDRHHDISRAAPTLQSLMQGLYLHWPSQIKTVKGLKSENRFPFHK